MPRKKRFVVNPLVEDAKAVAEKGVVILEGPHGLAISMTPEAAMKTSESLAVAAQLATQQAADLNKARRKKGGAETP